MLRDNFEAITYADIQALVTNGVAESLRLEYKRDALRPEGAAAREFAEDVAAFANAAGGDLLFGVDEQGGVAITAEGVNVDDIDAHLRRLESIIRSSIDPRIPGIQCRAITGGPQPIVLVRIPRSWLALHMVTADGLQRFVARIGASKYRLNVHEIRAGFVGANEVAERARRFRHERYAQILSGEPVAMRGLGVCIFHLIPASAFMPGLHLDLPSVFSSGLLQPLYPSGTNPRYTIDGILAAGDDTYLMLYETGIVEAASSQLVREPRRFGVPSDGGQVVAAGQVAESFFGVYARYVQTAKVLGIVPPVFGMATLGGVRDVPLLVPAIGLGVGTFFDQGRIDRDVIHLPEVLIESFDVSPDRALRPMLDGLWRAGGYERCDVYDQRGNWNPRR